METFDKVMLAIIIITFIAGIMITFVSVIDSGNEAEKCSREYGGQVENGYCIYVEDGTSKSYNIWDKEKTRGEE